MLPWEACAMRRGGWQFLMTALTLLAGPSALQAQDGEAFNKLAQSFKPLIISALPETLYEKTENWGHQVLVPVGVKWRGLRPQVMKSPRDHGEWRKLIISSQDLKRTFEVRIHDVKNVNVEKQTFKISLTFQMGVYYDQQNWESGVRLWSGSVRARAQVRAELECENTLKVELAKNGLPDFLLRLRVTKAKCNYDNLVVEHLNGIGGDGAKLIGRAVHEAMKQWRPDIERDLLAKANAAIVKAADTREVRIGFGSLLKTK
jgi:hypothetical protein